MAGVKGRFLGKLEEEQGAIIALVAFMMIGLLGFMALAVDLGHLYMVKNELQNAADAGALAGASVLYNDNATQVNAGANEVAYNTARSNRASIFPSGWSVVQVNWTSGTNIEDVQRGHYNYATGTFTANASLNPVDLLAGTESVLNADTNFINAVRVVTRTSTGSLFANFLGVASSDLSAEAIAYLGFAKELNPRDIDQPIAICQDWLYPSNPSQNPCDNYPVNNPWLNNYWLVPGTGDHVARWITLNQDPYRDISCTEPLTGNTHQLSFDDAMNVMPINSPIISGVQQADTAFRRLWENSRGFSLASEWAVGGPPSNRCAMNDVVPPLDGTGDTYIDAEPSGGDGKPERAWEFTLPIIDCSGNAVWTPILGRVKVRILWMNASPPPAPGWVQSYNVCNDTPSTMYNEISGNDGWTWRMTSANPPQCRPPFRNVCADQYDNTSPGCKWCSFAAHFRLRDYGGQTLYYCDPSSALPPPSPMPPELQNVMFIKPVCDTVNGTLQPVRPLTGSTGSQIYGQRGQLAKYPVLVK